MLRILKYALIFLISIVSSFALLVVGITMYLYIIGYFKFVEEQYQEKWDRSVHIDRQYFPNLSEPIFYFTRRDGGDSGAWVMVYPLDTKTKQAFLKQWHASEAKTSQSIECIKPTIKKRWRTRHSNIHYVQPSEMYRDHRDFKNHDSFIVFGSEKQIKTVEQGCMETAFKVIPKQEKDSYYQYWAIAEQQNLLFSVNELK